MIYNTVLACAKEQNISIRELERRAGLSNGAISKWEQSTPTVDNLISVAKVLDKPLEYFITGKEE